VGVKTCDEQIAQENDHLKREVKKLKLEANKLKKQAKVQPPQDNRNNMVKKLEKGKTHQRLLLNHQRSKFKRRRMKR
jgi:cell division protein FtsB